MHILKGTEPQVLHDLAVINQIAAAWWAAQGYTVVQGASGPELIGKDAYTGEDNPDACRTKTWAEPQEHPDGYWYIPSPVNDARFINWRDHIPEGVTIQCEEVEFVLGVVDEE
jgi:hypothetical protein